MKVSIGIGGAASGQERDFDAQVEYAVEAEKLGVDAVWTAEAWRQDAIAPLAYLAARTSRIHSIAAGSGVASLVQLLFRLRGAHSFRATDTHDRRRPPLGERFHGVVARCKSRYSTCQTV